MSDQNSSAAEDWRVRRARQQASTVAEFEKLGLKVTESGDPGYVSPQCEVHEIRAERQYVPAPEPVYQVSCSCGWEVKWEPNVPYAILGHKLNVLAARVGVEFR
jgi:hypothetical protein